MGFPGSLPHKNGLTVSLILKGSPTGQMFSKLRPFLPKKYNLLKY